MKDYEKTGVLKPSDIQMPSEEHLKKGVAILECVQAVSYTHLTLPTKA